MPTGNRSVLFDATTGTGTNFISAYDAVLDAANDRALVIDPWLNALFAVDLGSGDRLIISR